MTDETNPLTNPHLRTCGTCGCAVELGDPNNVAAKSLACRWQPPIARDQRVRLPDPSNPKRTVDAVQRSFMHAPTTAEATCFGGWCPKGTAPGENWQFAQLLAGLMAGSEPPAANG